MSSNSDYDIDEWWPSLPFQEWRETYEALHMWTQVVGKVKLDKNRQVNHWYDERVRFDSSFNMRTDDRMYCSEMIRKSLTAATAGRIALATTRPTPQEAKFYSAYLHLDSAYLSRLEITTIDNLYLNPHCRLLKRFDFNAKP